MQHKTTQHNATEPTITTEQSVQKGVGSAWGWALGRRDDFLYAGPMRTLCGSHAGDFGILRPACRRVFGERFALVRDSWGNDSVTQLVLPTICLYFRPLWSTSLLYI